MSDLPPDLPQRPKIRLYVEQPLAADQTVVLSRDAAHYLFNVMRLREGAAVALFNGRDGEWAASVITAGKRDGVLHCIAQTAPQRPQADIWLAFGPLKKARTDFLVEKAVELGVARICPVQTAFTNTERVRRERLHAHAVEAAEQCGATSVPEVADLLKLGAFLDDWPSGRTLYVADEAAAGPTDAAARFPIGGPAAILIGPEGGFAPEERRMLKARSFVRPIALGPRILRAETAALAALTLWQATWGDWR